MLSSILPFSPDLADRASQYCESHSDIPPDTLLAHWVQTTQKFGDADKMSSKLQGQWMIWLAEDRKPKRVLEIGTYSGFSALAWYLGTQKTKAEIVTLEINSEMIKAAKAAFERFKATDRIRLVEGPAGESIENLTGEFDLIFVDANKDGYEDYVKQILDKRLLSKDGVILADNVFARGLTLGQEFAPHLSNAVRPYWTANGVALDHFTKFLLEDERVSTVLLPLFDGVSFVKWRD
ncbi:putative SAM-dependent O-methyltransferase [Aspergillus sclerotioniger CBS 115572]|uniref:Putative SAM-dependent O-methyltransferase n=1 Tax=Aspergillus sclerotioniger CBS 115572 TaxID=1450535 RepID=A0A317WZD1_9EURO|nr:putative SAM-dependent O-methyltransferase [Aspergillus sclerotioniger CBS 115572]PWY91341.1 putative SAM-dependent O-methyltransferase [Aspergillus sclerotioniger CBS 115572]